MLNSTDEQAKLAQVAARLAADYPTMTPAEIAEVVRELHAAFDGARVRDFIPLLVERRAHSALDELSVPYA